MSPKTPINRAQAVRERRAQKHNQRLDLAGKQASQPLPPITSRKPSVGMSNTQPQAPRPFNLSMVLPSILPIEIPQIVGRSSAQTFYHSRLKVDRIGLVWRLISLIVCLGAVASIYFGMNSPTFQADQALITGNQRISPDEINSVLSIAGQPIFILDPEKIAIRLRQNYHEIASANVRVYFPNNVWVGMLERSPIIHWQQEGQYTWIDASGVAFKPRGPLPALIPVIATGSPPTGINLSSDPLDPNPFISIELVETIQYLAPHLPGGSIIQFDPQKGLGWKDERGWEVTIGNSSKNLNLKLQIYYTLVDSLAARGIQPVYISMQYPDAPYYRIAENNEDFSTGLDTE
jgi:hypothetical protein